VILRKSPGVGGIIVATFLSNTACCPDIFGEDRQPESSSKGIAPLRRTA
jgi:hypothetical protein